MAIARATAPLTTPGAIFTSSGTSAVTALYLCNYSASTVTVSIYVVPSAGSASDANIIYKDIAITASDTYLCDTERLVLSNGESIQISASAASAVNVTTSYLVL